MKPESSETTSLARQFEILGAVQQVTAIGAGHINDTYVVETRSTAGTRRYLLQRLNRHVFQDAAAVMENIRRVTAHLAKRRARSRAQMPNWETLTLIPCIDGSTHLVDAAGETWRMFDFIEPSMTIESTASPGQLYQAAMAYGHFEQALRDLPGPPLKETIAGFHDTPARFAAMEQTLGLDRLQRAANCVDEIDLARRLKPWASVLTDAQASGDVPTRVVHNDTKMNNVLFDGDAQHAICVVDLDTVMPGVAPFDFGDLVRSALPRWPEDGAPAELKLSTALFREIARGFIAGAGDAFSKTERELLPSGALVMSLEVGVRFLTDYLDGDQYFRIKHAEHNLERARSQLFLASAIESQLSSFSKIVSQA